MAAAERLASAAQGPPSGLSELASRVTRRSDHHVGAELLPQLGHHARRDAGDLHLTVGHARTMPTQPGQVCLRGQEPPRHRYQYLHLQL